MKINNNNIELAKQYFKGGRFEDCLDLLKPLLAENDKNLFVLDLCAVCFAQTGQLESAIGLLKDSVSLAPNRPKAQYNLGRALLELGYHEQALKHFKVAIKIQPNYYDAYNNKGICERELGLLQDACKSYEAAISLNNNLAEAYRNLAAVKKDLGDFKGSAASYEQALARRPGWPDAIQDFALLLYETHNFSAAAKLYRMVDNEFGSLGLLRSLFKLEDNEEFLAKLNEHTTKYYASNTIGSLTSRFAKKNGIELTNSFSADPYSLISINNLFIDLEFSEYVIAKSQKIITSQVTEYKKQGHLTNGVQTSGNIFSQNDFKIIEEKLVQCVQDYLHQHSGVAEGMFKYWPEEWYLYGWLVSYRNGGVIAPHIHDGSWLTGSLYINIPEKLGSNDGNLVLSMSDPVDLLKPSKDDYIVNVETGTLCLFPSSLLHHTLPFESDENRVVLAFDVMRKEF